MDIIRKTLIKVYKYNFKNRKRESLREIHFLHVSPHAGTNLYQNKLEGGGGGGLNCNFNF